MYIYIYIFFFQDVTHLSVSHLTSGTCDEILKKTTHSRCLFLAVLSWYLEMIGSLVEDGANVST